MNWEEILIYIHTPYTMKNLLLCSFLVCFFCSCSTDSEFNQSAPLSNTGPRSYSGLVFPSNISNPVDYKGTRYYDLLASYNKVNQIPNSSIELSAQIKFISNKMGYGRNFYKNIIPFNNAIVDSIMADPDNMLIVIVDNSLMGSTAKSSLISFLQGLLSKRDLEFAITHDYVISYEDDIIDNSNLSEDDRDTILTVTSISRYSLYSAAERKDRDWESSAGNRGAKRVLSNNDIALISIIALLKDIL